MEFDCAEEIRLDTVLENCIFYISPMYVFSHSQDPNRSSDLISVFGYRDGRINADRRD